MVMLKLNLDGCRVSELLGEKLLSQGYEESRLKSTFRIFFGRYNDLICKYQVHLSGMLTDLFQTSC